MARHTSAGGSETVDHDRAAQRSSEPPCARPGNSCRTLVRVTIVAAGQCRRREHRRRDDRAVRYLVRAHRCNRSECGGHMILDRLLVAACIASVALAYPGEGLAWALPFGVVLPWLLLRAR